MPLMSAFRREFGFRIKKKRRVRDVYRITGADGKDYCYKPFSFPEEEVAFLARIHLFLTGKGYRYTPRLAAPEGDKRWTCHRGKYWLLTNWVKGKHPNYRNPSHFRKGLRTLAKFHNQAEGYDVEAAPSNRVRYDQMLRLPAEYRKEITTYPELNGFLRYCERGEELLADPAVERLMATERKAGAFVHGDYNYPNVVLDRSHRLHLIDMENASLNVRVMDLAHILHRNCPWNADGMMTAIAEYDRKRPLGPDERFVLYALLVLPYPLVRAIRMYDWRYPRYVALPSYERQEAFAEALLGML